MTDSRVDLVVVDGPNLFGSVSRMLRGETSNADGALRAYISDWLDIDRLVSCTLTGLGDPLMGPVDPTLGIVIFHSKRALGEGDSRLDQPTTDQFWGRQGASPNTSSILVEIPGDQVESYPFKCKGCQLEQEASTSSEKGVDTSITTYILESSPRWESVCIFSRDVDFVPPVLALRRQGKRVYCASERGGKPTALERACQSFFPLDDDFVRKDFTAFRLLRAGGLLDELVNSIEQFGARPSIWVGAPPSNARGLTLSIHHSENNIDAPRIRGLVDGILKSRRPPEARWDLMNPNLVKLVLVEDPHVLEGIARHVEDVSARAAWRGFAE